jgi:hypothetical protein
MLVEKYARNGITKDCHNVVKNSPFTIHLTSSDRKFDFSNSNFECVLLYDSAEHKPIPFLQKLPLEFCVHRSPTSNTEITLEFRLKVLSSQFENSLFLIKITATNKETQQTASIMSAAIRVVSKPEQIRRKKESLQKAPPELSSTPQQRKRKREDEESETSTFIVTQQIFELLQAIKHGQEEQHKMFQKMFLNSSSNSYNHEHNHSHTPPPLHDDYHLFTDSPNPSSPSSLSDTESPKLTQSSLSSTLSFEETFALLIREYTALDPHCRIHKLRRLLLSHSSSLNFTQNVSHFAQVLNELLQCSSPFCTPSSSLPLSHYNSEQRQQQQQEEPEKVLCLTPHMTSKVCTCAHCPYQEELHRLDEFCSDFLTAETQHQQEDLVTLSNEYTD